ncbi:MAG: hypothetical protein JWP35_1639 [Caulobacter sp.]|nr:hypothetical protein [Caulobacter sp.]
MTAPRLLAAAVFALSLAGGLAGAPTPVAARETMTTKAGVTPDQMAVCLATVEVYISYMKAWNLPVDPIWPRYDAALQEATSHFDPALYEQAKAAGQARMDYDKAEIKRRTGDQVVGQMISDQLSDCARIIFLG